MVYCDREESVPDRRKCKLERHALRRLNYQRFLGFDDVARHVLGIIAMTSEVCHAKLLSAALGVLIIKQEREVENRITSAAS